MSERTAKERIQKVLANAGVASRRHVEEMIRQGRVSVNGRTVVALPALIDPDKDKVEVDDEPVPLGRGHDDPRLYILLNKPKKVYSTNVAQGEQTRALDLLPPDLPARVYPVGRLDAESKGLLLLTNDGDLTNQLTHPRYGIPKTYRAMVDGFVKPETLAELSAGVWLADPRSGKAFKTARSHIKIVKRSRGNTILEISLREGRNRQVRRMLAQLGHKVRELTRIQMGPLTLKGLAPGESRLLTPRELRELRDALKPRPDRPEKADAEPSPDGGTVPSSKPAGQTPHARPRPLPAGPTRNGKPARPGKSMRSGEPTRTGKPTRPGKPMRSNDSARPAKPPRPGQPPRHKPSPAGKFDATGKPPRGKHGPSFPQNPRPPRPARAPAPPRPPAKPAPRYPL